MVTRRSLYLCIYCLLVLADPVTAQSPVIEKLSRYARQHGIPHGRDFRKYLEQGLGDLREESYEEAVAAFASASKISPHHPLSNFYFAASLFALEEYALSGRVLRRTVHLYPHWESLALDVATLFPPTFEFFEKLRRFEKWLLASTRSTDSYFLYAFLWQFAGNANKAKGAYRSILKRDPAYVEAYILLELLGEVRELFPSFESLAQKAEKYFAEGEYGKAASVYADAYAYYPQRNEVLYPLTHSLSAEKYFSHAAVVLRMAIRFSPDRFSEQFGARQHFHDPNHFDQMLLKIEEKLQQGFFDDDLLLLLSYFYLVIKERKRAEFVLEKIRERSGGDPQVKFLQQQLSQIPEDAPEQEEREPEHPKNERTVERKPPPSPENPILLQGLDAFRAKKYKEAAKFFTTAYVQEPTDYEMQSFLAMVAFALGKYQSTYRTIRSLLQNPRQKDKLLNWVQYYASKREFSSHIKKLNAWVMGHPNDDPSLFVLVYVLLANDKLQQARILFDKLERRMPDDPDVRYLRKILQR